MKKSINVEFEHSDFQELGHEDQFLLSEAKKVMRGAYAPYSEFRVGAAVLLDNGEIILGSNQENMAYPSGLCAERVALFYAGANFPTQKVIKIAIVAEGDFLKEAMNLSPCGGCRQVMVETEIRQKEDFKVLLLNNDNTVNIFPSAKELLPLSFGT